MTLVVEREVHGPATHALVIGVAHYRHLRGGSGPVMARNLGLQQLQAPRPSVREMVAFLADEYRNRAAPLATVDLLVSPTTPGAEGGPTMAAVKIAIQDWYGRCNSDPGNVAIFYFCGHGLERDSQYLLMEDFGAFEGSLMGNALNMTRFHRGMAQCAAGTQLFFVDACREVSRELRALVVSGGESVLEPRLDGNLARDAPILYATAQGRKAFARTGASTQYVQALLQSLRGAGASKSPDDQDRWQVRYHRLASVVGQLLRSTADGRSTQEVRTGGEAGDALVHELDGPPEVSVTVRCDPDTCARLAGLRLESLRDGHRYLRDPADGPWQLRAVADAYSLNAVVDPPWQAAQKLVLVEPPLTGCTITVQS